MAKYRITPSSKAIIQLPISIGHKAEKGVEAIEFDVTAWVETYGSGTATIIMRRWGDAIPYPIALEIDENNKATWTLSDTDTAKAGMAYAQLSYVVGETVVKKSDIYTFRVMDSLTGEGEPPEAYESWLEHLTHLAAEAMAEVLDIESIVTDKTLTVDGGIADAKATGDALSALEDQFTEETDQLRADLDAIRDTVDTNTIHLMDVCINAFLPKSSDYLIGKGFSGKTGTIVDAIMNVITGYIPVKKNDYVQVFVNDINILNTWVDGQNRKIAFYNSNKDWYKTATYIGTNDSPDALKITQDGFIRVMLRRKEKREIYVSSLRKDRTVDLLLFCGQSNMAGRGVTSTEHPQTAPDVIDGAGYEYRAISAPDTLSPITATFGLNENNPDGINDGTSKTGGMVPAFTNAYYTANGNVPIVGVSASKGGTSTSSWLPSGAFFNDITERVNKARAFLADNIYAVRHQYVVFCQGESDGDNIANDIETLAQYQENTLAIVNGFIELGFEKVLLVRIGNYNVSTSNRYKPIIEWQTELAQTNKNVVMVSCDFAGMMADGLMKDHFHYYQEGYNITGDSAGTNSAFFAMTQKEPTMYDSEYNNLYYTHVKAVN